MRKTFAALLCIALLASAALPAHAADPLTDGEILYSEDFSWSLVDLIAKEGVKLSVGSACEASVTDGAANANMSLAVETKSGVWYTLYTAVDSAAGTYSMYRQADGEMERTVIAENMQLQAKGSAPMVRIMTQRNSDAVAYVDDIVIRAYAPAAASETTAVPEAIAAPAEESAPQTADTAVVMACAAAAAALGVCVSKRKKR